MTEYQLRDPEYPDTCGECGARLKLIEVLPNYDLMECICCRLQIKVADE